MATTRIGRRFSIFTLRSPRAGGRLRHRQRLLKVRGDVVHILDAGRQADQPAQGASAFARLQGRRSAGR